MEGSFCYSEYLVVATSRAIAHIYLIRREWYLLIFAENLSIILLASMKHATRGLGNIRDRINWYQILLRIVLAIIYFF